MTKERWIRVGRWVMVLPAHLATPLILNALIDLFSRFWTPAHAKYLDLLWFDIVVRLASFWVAVRLAPSRKRMIFLTLLAFWSIFAAAYAVLDIAHGQSWLLAVGLVLQLAALLVLMSRLDLSDD